MGVREIVAAVEAMKAGDVAEQVRQKMDDFSGFASRPDKEWFAELCFCILAANAKAHTSFAIQKELGAHRLLHAPHAQVLGVIRKHNHRFHNNKARFIMEARAHHPIKEKVQAIVSKTAGTRKKNSDDALRAEQEARSWIAQNVNGIGMKEASHFLRNTGFRNLAIVDRHIINILCAHRIIRRPVSITPKVYLHIERRLAQIAQQANLSQAELDLYLWYMQAGFILK